jgi:hypothetical protein
MHPRAQELYPIQAKYYRAMVFYQRARWAANLWLASVPLLNFGIWKMLQSPWALLLMLLHVAVGGWVLGWRMPWLYNRYLRCRRVYRVMNWKPQLRFSHARAWANWDDERILPTVVPVRIASNHTVYSK